MGCNTKGVRGRKRKTSKNDLQNQFSCAILTLSLKLNTNRNISDTLLWMASLVNIYIEFDHIWGSYGQKTSQKKSKMISYGLENTWTLKTRKVQIRHKWNLTHTCTTAILSIYHKIGVLIDGRVVVGGNTYKKPAKHGIKLTIFLYFNIT